MNAPWITAPAHDDYLPAWPVAPWIFPAPGQPTRGEAFYRYTFPASNPARITTETVEMLPVSSAVHLPLR